MATGGSFTILLNAALADGTYSVTATATDAAGNVSPTSATFSPTIDATPPAAPRPPLSRGFDDSGTVGDGITERQPAAADRDGLRPGATVHLLAGQQARLRRHGHADGRDLHDPGRVGPGRRGVFDHRDGYRCRGQRGCGARILVLTIDTAACRALRPRPRCWRPTTPGAVGDGITNVSRPRADRDGRARATGSSPAQIAGSVVGVGNGWRLGGPDLERGPWPTARMRSRPGPPTPPANRRGRAPLLPWTIDATPPARRRSPAYGGRRIRRDGRMESRKSGSPGSSRHGRGRFDRIRLFIPAPLPRHGHGDGRRCTYYGIRPDSPLADGTPTRSPPPRPTPRVSSSAAGRPRLTIDATQPAAPSAPVLLAGPTTRGMLGDGITNDSTPRLTGLAEAGLTVQALRRRSVGRDGRGGGGSYSIAAIAPALGDRPTRSRTGHRPRRQHAGLASAPAAHDRLSAARQRLTAPGFARGRRLGAFGRRDHEVARPWLTTAEPGTTVQLSLGGKLGHRARGRHGRLVHDPPQHGTARTVPTRHRYRDRRCGEHQVRRALFVLTIDTIELRRRPPWSSRRPTTRGR